MDTFPFSLCEALLFLLIISAGHIWKQAMAGPLLSSLTMIDSSSNLTVVAEVAEEIVRYYKSS